MVCPSCGATVTDGDAFCEACGATVSTGATPVERRADAPPRADGPPRTSQLPPPRNGDRAPVRACAACGGEVDEDGFCSTCGQRAPTERDHWVESPADWVGGVCDRGIVHARNEDAMALAATPDRSRAVLVVCDGVTSAADSDRASIAAARSACALLTAAPAAPSASVAARVSHWEAHLRAACAEANAAAVAVAHALGDPAEPPSCTFVAAVVDGDVVTVAWCGDSRAYWLPDDPAAARQLGDDHSMGAALIAAGTPEREAEADPRFHVITRWLGADAGDPRPDVVSAQLDGPGWVLVCSDGMWNDAPSPAALRALVDEAVGAGATTPVAIAESLAAWANLQGGRDNITVALARSSPRVP